MLAALRAYPALRDDAQPARLAASRSPTARRSTRTAHGAGGPCRWRGARADGRRPAATPEPALWRAVRRLPEKQRAAVTLRFAGDLDYAAIGVAIDCSEAGGAPERAVPALPRSGGSGDMNDRIRGSPPGRSRRDCWTWHTRTVDAPFGRLVAATRRAGAGRRSRRNATSDVLEESGQRGSRRGCSRRRPGWTASAASSTSTSRAAARVRPAARLAALGTASGCGRGRPPARSPTARCAPTPSWRRGRQPAGGARRRATPWPEPDPDRRALPPRAAHRRRPGRLRRRARVQALAARPRVGHPAALSSRVRARWRGRRGRSRTLRQLRLELGVCARAVADVGEEHPPGPELAAPP